MIPKIIHFVWLGGGEFTPSVKRCINSWKQFMPDYEIKCWNENTFDINSVAWVKEAIEKKKWSLASDYIRHYAIYTEGGIYMDTDVQVYKNFDEFLSNSFFTSVEFHPNDFKNKGISQIDKFGNPLRKGEAICGIGLLAALYGAEKGNPFIKECMDYFGNRHFVNNDGSLYMDIINPAIMATLLNDYGFKYIDKKQDLGKGIVVYPSSVFAGDISTRTANSYSMHWCDSSWRSEDFGLIDKIRLKLKIYFPQLFRK